MDWFFGSSKKNSKPEVYVSNVVEGDFNVVSSHEPVRPPYPLYPNLPTNAYRPPNYPTSVYPPQHQSSGNPPQHQSSGNPPHLPSSSGYLAQHSQYIQQPYRQQQSSTSQKSTNPLDSIPFKLSTALDSKSLPINEYQLKSIKSNLDSVSNRINSDSYNYSFELERSVLNELNCR